MASMTPNAAKVSFARGEIAWLTDTIRVVLLTNLYVPNKDTDQFWSDINANEFVGGSYTAGGLTLASKTVGQDNTNDRATLGSANVQFTGITGTFRYVALLDWTGTASTTRIIRVIDPEGAIVTLTNGTYDLTVPVGGWLSIQD